MRKNKILSVIGGLAAFIFTSCDGIFDVDYYTFLPEDYIFTNESTIEEGLLGCYELLYPNSFGGSSWGVRPHMMLANLPTLDVQASGAYSKSSIMSFHISSAVSGRGLAGEVE